MRWMEVLRLEVAICYFILFYIINNLVWAIYFIPTVCVCFAPVHVRCTDDPGVRDSEHKHTWVYTIDLCVALFCLNWCTHRGKMLRYLESNHLLFHCCCGNDAMLFFLQCIFQTRCLTHRKQHRLYIYSIYKCIFLLLAHTHTYTIFRHVAGQSSASRRIESSVSFVQQSIRHNIVLNWNCQFCCIYAMKTCSNKHYFQSASRCLLVDNNCQMSAGVRARSQKRDASCTMARTLIHCSVHI